METFILLCICHVLGDFVFQNDDMAKGKVTDDSLYRRHIGIYSCCMLPFFLCAPFFQAVCPWLIISVSHALIDLIRCKKTENLIDCLSSKKQGTDTKSEVSEEQKKQQSKDKVLYFLIDQMSHIFLIYICCLFDLKSYNEFLYQQLLSNYPDLKAILGYVLIGLLIWEPAKILVSNVIDLLPKHSPKHTRKTVVIRRKNHIHRKVIVYPREKTNTQEDNSIFQAGSIIGILERFIVVVLVLLNAANAIGLVIAAKSIVRIKQFENDVAFSERYLVGTLLSVSIALSVVFLVKIFYPFV